MIESEKKFDHKRYIMEKTLKILRQNKGVKLTKQTLTDLQAAGFELISSVD